MAALETTNEATLESGLTTLFARVRAGLPGPAWLAALRAEALGRVVRQGLPHRRVEAWKYTDLRNKLADGLDVASGSGEAIPSIVGQVPAHHIDLNGGRLLRAPSAEELPDGVEIMSLAESLGSPSLWLRQ